MYRGFHRRCFQLVATLALYLLAARPHGGPGGYLENRLESRLGKREGGKEDGTARTLRDGAPHRIHAVPHADATRYRSRRSAACV